MHARMNRQVSVCVCVCVGRHELWPGHIPPGHTQATQAVVVVTRLLLPRDAFRQKTPNLLRVHHVPFVHVCTCGTCVRCILTDACAHESAPEYPAHAGRGEGACDDFAIRRTSRADASLAGGIECTSGCTLAYCRARGSLASPACGPGALRCVETI